VRLPSLVGKVAAAVCVAISLLLGRKTKAKVLAPGLKTA
jgi:hypothetical protein